MIYLIICDTDKAIDLQKFAIEAIDKNDKLEIQPNKVEIIEFAKNNAGKIRAFNKKKLDEKGIEITSSSSSKYYKSLQYLGFEFNGQNITIRSSSLSRYYRKMKARIVKTVSMAYSEAGKSDKIWKQQLLHRYTHLGKSNFLKYAYNASKEEYLNNNKEKKQGMNSPAIRKQISRHFDILISSLEKKNSQRFSYKSYKGKAKSIKKV